MDYQILHQLNLEYELQQEFDRKNPKLGYRQAWPFVFKLGMIAVNLRQS